MKTGDKIHLIKPEVNECVIEQIKIVLKMALEGKIKNIFVIMEHTTEDPIFVQAGEHDPVKLLGLLDWAKARWREEQVVTWMDEDYDA